MQKTLGARNTDPKVFCIVKRVVQIIIWVKAPSSLSRAVSLCRKMDYQRFLVGKVTGGLRGMDTGAMSGTKSGGNIKATGIAIDIN